MAGTAELHKAVKDAWDTANLDNWFKNYWSAADRNANIVLHDAEAAPGTPFPYCVFEIMTGNVTTRMSGTSGINYMVMDISWRFKIFAQQAGAYSAKTVAITLADKLLEVFGGHPSPTATPASLDLENYGFLITQYLRDYGMRVGDLEHLWVIEYLIRLDMPVAV